MINIDEDLCEFQGTLYRLYLEGVEKKLPGARPLRAEEFINSFPGVMSIISEEPQERLTERERKRLIALAINIFVDFTIDMERANGDFSKVISGKLCMN